MNWLYYLAEANLYLAVFYAAYCLFLNTETHYQLNRAYLISSCVISFILPVLQLGILKPVEVMQTSTVDYIQPIATTPQLPAATTTLAPVVATPQFSADDYLFYGYLLGAAVLLIILAIKLISLYKLVRNAQTTQKDNYKLVQLPQTDVAFSFFKYLFIGKNVDGINTIIRHELVHIRQKHSVDIVFLELLKIINWFNPFIYLLQNSLKTVHEYIADEQTAAHETDPIAYSTFLLNNAYGNGGPAVSHSFFNYNLLKRRIIMLNQKRSGNLAKLRYLIAIPVCAAALCASTLAFSKNYGWVDIAPAKAVIAEVQPAQDKVEIPMPMPMPIPSSTSKGYDYLHHQVMKTVSFTPAAKNTGKTVIIGFDVDKKGMLANIKIEKSGGNEFDAQALKPFKTFNMPVKDKAGHRRAMIVFYNGQKIGDINKVFNDDPSFAGFWVVSGWKYKPDRTAKGFEYDQFAENIDGKINYRVVIYGANGDFFKASRNEATAAQLATLKNKYGYIFPQDEKKSTSTHKRDKNDAYFVNGRLNNSQIALSSLISADPKFMIIVNGKQYKFDQERVAKYKPKALIAISCDKVTVYNKGNKYAETKWGKDVGKVVILEGNASLKFVDYESAKQSDSDDLILASTTTGSLNKDNNAVAFKADSLPTSVAAL